MEFSAETNVFRSAKSIHSYIACQLYGKASLQQLEEHFPNIKDLKSALLSRNDIFWMAQLSDDQWEIRSKVDVKLCRQYMLSTDACSGECRKLHLCKDYLVSPKFCHFPCKKNFSHDIRSEHNLEILSIAVPKAYGKVERILSILRSSLPRLCQDFKKTGKCISPFCGYLHMCSYYIKGECTGECKQALLAGMTNSEVHDFTTPHNQKVLSMFSLFDAEGRVSVNEVKANILFSDCGSLVARNRNLASSQSMPNISTEGVRGGIKSGTRKRFVTKRMHSTSPSGSLSDIPVHIHEGSEDCDLAQIHKFVAYSCNGKAVLGEIESQFPKSQNLKSRILWSGMFWAAKLATGQWEVRPIIDIKFCIRYMNDAGGCNGECMQLHLCKDHLLSPKFCGNPCGMSWSHDILSPHNQKVIAKKLPECYGKKVGHNAAYKVLRASFPRLCQQFTKQGKCSSEFCGYLHMCPDYIMGECIGKCKQAVLSGVTEQEVHELSTGHNERIMRIFSFQCEDFNTKENVANVLFSKQSSVDVRKDSETRSSNRNLTSSQSMSSIEESQIESGIIRQNPTNVTDLSSVPYNETNLLQRFFKLKLCFYYLYGNCTKKNCPGLHMCKEFLIGASNCHGQCLYGFSHNPLDYHNQSVLNIQHEIPSRKIVDLLRKSFPRVCQYYLNGKCRYSQLGQCGRLHICYSIISDAQCQGRGCSKSHNLHDKHNLTVLKKFFLNDIPLIDKQSRDYLLVNVMFSKSTLQSDSMKISPTGHDISKQKMKTKNDASVEAKTKEKDALPLLKWLVSPPNAGSMTLNALFDKDVLYGHSDFFRIVKDKENNETLFACLKNVKPCFNYWRKSGGCSVPECDMFHICKKLIFDDQHHVDTPCESNHNFQSDHERKLIALYDLTTFTNEQIQVILQVRYPLVCVEYLRQACPYGEDLCPHVHVCKRFLQGKCDQPCRLQHEKGLLNGHARRLAKEFHVSMSYFRRCVMLPKPRWKEKGHACPPLSPSALNQRNVNVNANISTGKINSPESCKTSLGSIVRSHVSYAGSLNPSLSESETMPIPDKRSQKLPLSNLKKETREKAGWKEPSEIDIFAYILENAENSQGYVSMHESGLCKTHFGDSKENMMNWFEKHLATFRIDKSDPTLGPFFYLCIENIAPCCEYWSTGNCEKPNCKKFHICKKFLHGIQHSEILCQFNHSFQSDHEQELIKSNQLDALSLEDLQLLLRIRYPFVCQDYLRGSCSYGEDNCSCVHVCGDYLLGECSQRDGVCSFNHDYGLISKQANRIMKKYHIETLLYFKKCIVYFRTEKDDDTSQEMMAELIRHDHPSSFSACNKQSSKDLFTNDVALSLSALKTESTVGKISRKLPLSNLKKENQEMAGWREPSEIDIFEYILNQTDNSEGYVSMDKSELRKTHFDDSEENMMNWFEKHLSTFRIDKSDPTLGPFFYLCIENIAPCCEYWSTDNCEKPNCKKFHICKKFLHGIQHSEILCQFNHSFQSDHEQELIKSNQLDALSLKDLQLLLRIRYPFVCQDYLKFSCSYGEDNCSCVHVCGDYLLGECSKPEGLCSFNHDYGLKSKQALRVIDEYHIKVPSEFEKCIIYFKTELEDGTSQERMVKLKPDFDWLREEAICYKNLTEECHSCNLFHLESGLPYAWQYGSNDTWRMFSSRLNTELEKHYCDPENASFDSTSIDPNLQQLIVQDGSWSSGVYEGSTVSIRRLSTKSSVLCSDDDAVGLTEWKWYWKNKKTWDEYSKGTSGDKIEMAYHTQSQQLFNFRTGEFQYTLSFDKMQQQNMSEKYLTKRDVRRRPLYKAKKDLRKIQIKKVANNDLPWHWPIKEVGLNGGRIDVEPSTRNKIEMQFKLSIGSNVEVVDVAEVCNAEFYLKYQSKKNLLIKKLGIDNINELSLYHGTMENVVNGICAHNFDWRLCGKNGTAYGEGSYFAKNASYSHRYASPDIKNLRCMFVAQVLVGKYTQASSSMKRPPVINPSLDAHALYDSCVNNTQDPSIYVIFERDQCYPQYLITYKDASTPSVGSSFGRLMSAHRYTLSYTRTSQRPQPLSKPS